MDWTEEFFDEYYLQSIDKLTGEEQTRREVDFLLEKINLAKDDAILDLACGHGRHALDLAGRGFSQITGIDITLTYIEMARQKASGLPSPPRFIDADMRELSYRTRYKLIYSLFTSMFYFSDEDNLDILKRVFEALKSGGYFVVDYFNPPAFLKSGKRKDWYITANDSVILDKFSHNPISGVITTERLIITPEGKRIKRVFHLRDYTVSELRFHFESIGFEILDVFGNFEGEKYHVDSTRQIYFMSKK